MATHKALVSTGYNKPLELQTVPTPTATPGTAVIQVLSTFVLSYMKDVLSGARSYPLTFPLTPGACPIGRISAVGADAVFLKPGQLVFCEATIRARDDPDTTILLGFHGGVTPAARKLMDGEWRDGACAQFARFPLENVYPLDEQVLLGSPGLGLGLGYKVPDLCAIPTFLVPFGGLDEIGLKPGETVIVAPATGRFGGAAVIVALAMGATVIACGRNQTTLDSLSTQFASTGRLRTVQFSGTASSDTSALLAALPSRSSGADAYIDFSPPAAAGTTHIEACIGALRTGGRCSLMGGITGGVMIPYGLVMHGNLQIRGRFMYTREQIQRMLGMVEAGVLRLGERGAGIRTVGEFGLDQMEQAMELSEKMQGWNCQVVLTM